MKIAQEVMSQQQDILGATGLTAASGKSYVKVANFDDFFLFFSLTLKPSVFVLFSPYLA